MESRKKRKRNKQADRHTQKKKSAENFCSKKKEMLAENDKGLWYSQPPNEIQNTAAISATSSSRKKLISPNVPVESELKELAVLLLVLH